MPARQIKPTTSSVAGRLFSAKAGSLKDAESSLEQDFMTLLEFDRLVAEYAVQPVTIRWRDQAGRKRRYTPDVLVTYRQLALPDGHPPIPPTLFEVKPEVVLRERWTELQPKFRAATGYARSHGMRFKLVTERRIRTPRLANAKFLLRYRATVLRPEGNLVEARQRRIRKKLWELRRTTPATLLEALTPLPEAQAELLPWLWYLVNQGLVGANLDRALTMDSEIWSAETPITLREMERMPA